MIETKKTSIVLVFDRNRVLIKTNGKWTFYTPTVLTAEKVIEEIMAEGGLAEDIQSFHDNLDQLGMTIINVFRSSPEATVLLIDKLCKKAIDQLRKDRGGDDFSKYRRYMDYLFMFIKRLQEIRTTIPTVTYLNQIIETMKKTIANIAQAIPSNNN